MKPTLRDLSKALKDPSFRPFEAGRGLVENLRLYLQRKGISHFSTSRPKKQPTSPDKQQPKDWTRKGR